MKHPLTVIYKKHHAENRSTGFSIWKSERAELIDSYLGDRKHILDIGCRDGALMSEYMKGRSVTGFDIDERALKSTSKVGAVETRVVDLNGEWHVDISQKYEGVVMAETLEHLYFPDVVLVKIKSVLGENGILVGSVPNAFSLRNRLRYMKGQKRNTPLSDPTHINQFTYNELFDLLSSQFAFVKIIPLVRKPFNALAKIFPSLFAHSMFFIASDRSFE